MTLTFETKIENFSPEQLWHFHFNVPEGVYTTLLTDGKRVIANINSCISYPCALMHDGLGGYFITINAEIRKKLKLQLGDVITVSLTPDKSKYGMPMCEEFEELLNQDDESLWYFDKLTPGKQRSLIYIINKIKSSDLRITKAIRIMNYLKSCQGEIDYKELQTALRSDLPKI
jgi:hypothetical protein